MISSHDWSLFGTPDQGVALCCRQHGIVGYPETPNQAARMREQHEQQDKPYSRTLLVHLLIHHWHELGKGCGGCGWSSLGESWAAHVADVYERAVQADAPLCSTCDHPVEAHVPTFGCYCRCTVTVR